jgi:hypothetical protein
MIRAALIRQTTSRKTTGHRYRGGYGVWKPIALHVPLFILYRKQAGDEGLDCRCELQCLFLLAVAKALPLLNSKPQSLLLFLPRPICVAIRPPFFDIPLWQIRHGREQQ